MTIIAYDGETLCVDGAAVQQGIKHELTKSWQFGTEVITGEGDYTQIAAMRAWYEAGADPDKFPATQRVGMPWCQLIVVGPKGLRRYEKSPVPVDHGHNRCAFGVGKDFAYGALAVGATAELAVYAASQFVPDCGHKPSIYVWKGVTNEEINGKAH